MPLLTLLSQQVSGAVTASGTHWYWQANVPTISTGERITASGATWAWTRGTATVEADVAVAVTASGSAWPWDNSGIADVETFSNQALTPVGVTWPWVAGVPVIRTAPFITVSIIDVGSSWTWQSGVARVNGDVSRSVWYAYYGIVGSAAGGPGGGQDPAAVGWHAIYQNAGWRSALIQEDWVSKEKRN